MGLELDPVIVHPSQDLQREHLEPAGIGEQRTGPGHEPMQSSERCDGFLAGAHVQMVGIAENHPRLCRLEVERRERANRSLRADRHEDRRFDHAVRQGQCAGAGGTGVALELELEHGRKLAVERDGRDGRQRAGGSLRVL